jgi:hypothetical protein
MLIVAYCPHTVLQVTVSWRMQYGCLTWSRRLARLMPATCMCL